MNANAIQVGHEYAFTEWPSRNRTYYSNARRVRVLHVYKSLERPHYQKRITLVEAVFLDENGNVNSSRNLITAAARHFIATWTEHLVEKERYDSELKERRREREETDRQYFENQRRLDEERQERIRLENEKKEKYILEMSKRLGIPKYMVRIYANVISVNLLDLQKEWGDLNTEQSTEQIADQDITVA